MKKRIAFFGPLNPTPSGISDYDEELLPLLREHFDVDIFLDSFVPPASRPPAQPGAYNHSSFFFRNTSRPYDLTIYQLGNALLHEYMYGFLFRYPGAVIVHDYCLHQSRAKMLLTRKMKEEYRQEAESQYPGDSRIRDIVAMGRAGNLLQYYYPFVSLILRASLAAGAHTDYTVQRLREAGPAPVVKIPMAVRSSHHDPARADEYPGKILIASFGLVTMEKRLTPVLLALQELRCFYPDLRYVVVGDVAPHYDFRGQVASLGLSDIVEVTGRVDHARFHSLMRRADIIINLRYPSAGEMSATLLRALACGKPVMISRLQQLAEIPSEAAIRVRPDREQEDVFSNLWRLIEDPLLRGRQGDRAAEYIADSHRPEQMVQGYLQLIESALKRKADFRPPDLPLHLRSADEIIREYIKSTCFAGHNSELLRALVV